MDYLSLLTLQAGQADVSAVVLNSITNLEKAIPFLSKHKKINAFLDNDEAGKRKYRLSLKLNTKEYFELKSLAHVQGVWYIKKTAKKLLQILDELLKRIRL